MKYVQGKRMTTINIARDFGFPGDNAIQFSWCQPFLASSRSNVFILQNCRPTTYAGHLE